MNDRDNKPFADILTALAQDEAVSIPLLFRLSDMTPAETSAFWSWWPTLSTKRRQVIMRHLADLSEDNFQVDFAPIFGRCLDDEAAVVRRAALDGLWDSSDTRLVRKIIHRLETDEAPAVRAAAAAALAHYILMAEWGQVPSSIKPPIIAALLARWDDPTCELATRRAVVEALGPAANPRVADIIEKAYHSREYELQRSALFAMGSSADPRWLSIVTAEMESPEAEMRAEAARAAGSIGRGDAVTGLATLLQDDDPDVVRAAIQALSQLGSDEARHLLISLQDELEESGDDVLLDLVDEAVEEMDWFGSGLDFSLLDWGGEGNDNDNDETDTNRPRLSV